MALVEYVTLGVGVSEKVLVSSLGQPYPTYRSHTKRLIPGVW